MSEQNEKREVTSLKVNPKLWKKVKIQAIIEDKTVSLLVEKILENYLQDNARKERD